MRRRFAAIYLLNRGVKPPERDVLIVREERPPAYLEALAALIGSITGEDVSVASDYRIAMPLTVLNQFDLSKNLSDDSYLGVWSSVSGQGGCAITVWIFPNNVGDVLTTWGRK